MDAVVTSEQTLDFEEYVALKRPALLRAARAITQNPDTAEDLLQTALANVFGRWSSIRDQAAADAYVRRAMINQHNSWLRQKWRTHEQATDRIPESVDPAAGNAWSGIRPDPDLWALVTALPPRQRSAVVLRYYEDLSEAETARIMRCAIGTVKWTTSRGLDTMRRLATTAETPGGARPTRIRASRKATAR